MQYLLLEKDQIKCFPFISNPRKHENGYIHEHKDFAEMFVPNLDIKENLIIINEYFEKKFELNEMNSTDKQIWKILNPKVKNIFEKIDPAGSVLNQ